MLSKKLLVVFIFFAGMPLLSYGQQCSGVYCTKPGVVSEVTTFYRVDQNPVPERPEIQLKVNGSAGETGSPCSIYFTLFDPATDTWTDRTELLYGLIREARATATPVDLYYVLSDDACEIYGMKLR